MSRENAEIIRRAVAAMNRRDLDAFIACLHPDVEWEESTDAFPGLTGTYCGRARVRRWAEQAVLELWASLELEIEEITETGDGRVLLETLVTARGTASGVDTEIRAWQLFWFADERISRRRGPFWDRDVALEAVGVRV